MSDRYPALTVDCLECPPLVIWCPNKELIPELAIIFDQYDIRWMSGDSFDEASSRWYMYREGTCYRLSKSMKLQYADLEFYRREIEMFSPIYEFTGIHCFEPVDVEDLL